MNTIEIKGKLFGEKHNVKINRYFVSENEDKQKTLGYFLAKDKDKVATRAIGNMKGLIGPNKKFPNIIIEKMSIGRDKYLTMVIFLGSLIEGKSMAKTKKELKEAMKDFDRNMDYENKVQKSWG